MRRSLIDVFAYCEPVWATGTSRQHIRMLNPGEGRVFGGGLTLPALCGLEVAWDLDLDVIDPLADSRVCKDCARVWGSVVFARVP